MRKTNSGFIGVGFMLIAAIIGLVLVKDSHDVHEKDAAEVNQYLANPVLSKTYYKNECKESWVTVPGIQIGGK